MSAPAVPDPRDRLTQVFQFLEELNRIRNPVTRDLRSSKTWFRWLDTLPSHPLVEFHPPTLGSATEEDGGAGRPLLRVRRAESAPPPTPPDEIAGAVNEDWKNPAVEVVAPEKYHDVAGLDPAEETKRASRRQTFESWKARRDAWAAEELLTREARELFEALYSLHGDMERESGKYELLIGDGHLLWKHEIGEIRHPLLLQRVQLEFDPSVPSFEVSELNAPSELYATLLTNLAEVSGARLTEVREELEQSGVHPFGGDTTETFLRRLALVLGPHGRLSEEGPDAPLPEEPVLVRRPVFFRRKKSQGMAAALGHILRDIQDGGDVSSALMRIVGAMGEDGGDGASEERGDATGSGDEPLEVLLAKPANPEQVQIAERLDRHGAVLVQGPPGTGKTHTIGNLIGHLLAQGKSVLVTSQGTKALRVLRNQIPEPLQPLCVSVLDDAESQRQLEASITAIAERLATADASSLEREAANLDKQRRHQAQQLKSLRQGLLEARADEYREIVFGGSALDPAKAAREVAKEAGIHDWIPPPVELGAAMPLTNSEVHRLYALNRMLSMADERELQEPLPDPNTLPGPSEFKELVASFRTLTEAAAGDVPSYWLLEPAADDLRALDAALRNLQLSLEDLPAWKAEAIEAGEVGGGRLEPWNVLIELIERVVHAADTAAPILLEHDPQPTHEEAERPETAAIVAEVRQHLEGGGRLSGWVLLTRRHWKRFLSEWELATGEVTSLEQVKAIQHRIELTLLRRQLVGRWNRQLVPLGLPDAEGMGPTPERMAQQHAHGFRRFLRWYPETFLPFERLVGQAGLRWEAVLDAHPPVLEAYGALGRLRTIVQGKLPSLIESRKAKVELGVVERGLTQIVSILEGFGGTASPSDVVRGLSAAINEKSDAHYADAHARLVELQAKRADLLDRRALLERVDAVAPGWAQAVRQRLDAHAESVPPGEPEAAWRWRQLNDELERRGKVRLEDLQNEIERVSTDLRRTTVKLIDRKAWAAQVRRSTPQQRQTLMGWLDTVKRIGKGTGKRVPRLRAEASRAISRCRDAVPVWVMSLDQVALNFPASTRFDVVIIDEASQSDAMALAAVYLGKQVVVVGDHEQVSPSAVGENSARVDRIIDQHLKGIPNASLYTGQLSVYDLARQSFGGIICLREHFRSVPDIIRFSSELAYDGKIEPLRDAYSSTLRPAVTAFRVRGGVAENKVNEEEAKAVTSLIVAATRKPAYMGKTFGVISLVGDEQALLIEQKLREALSPAEYDRRRLLCGNAAQFQGDERDVMFLSMVDSSKDGPLMLRGTGNKTFKQRFNVAASRARDQMWVVHSLDLGTDLKPDDLRRRLLEHCTDPRAVEQRFERELGKTESPFEQEVFKRLTRAGYRVTPQWPVGSYRIDLVVEGANGKLAVECDGDRYHPAEKLADDMARQAVLERLGWRFARIRGSAFFRDPEGAMVPVFERLEALGIEPGGQQTLSSAAEGSEVLQSVIRDAERLVKTWRGGGELEAADIEKAVVGAELRVLPSPDQPLEKPVRPEAPKNTELPRTQQHVPEVTYINRGPPTQRASVIPWPRSAAVTQASAQELTAEAQAEGQDDPLLSAFTENEASAASKVPIALPEPEAPHAPVMDALRQVHSPGDLSCPDCGEPRDILIGRFGPFLKCRDRSCSGNESVSRDLQSRALALLSLRCVCGAPYKIAKGRSVFIGCSGYPECRESFSWKEFRARFADE